MERYIRVVVTAEDGGSDVDPSDEVDLETSTEWASYIRAVVIAEDGGSNGDPSEDGDLQTSRNGKCTFELVTAEATAIQATRSTCEH